MDEVDQLHQLIQHCQNVKKTTERIRLLRQHGQSIQHLLTLIYDHKTKFFVTPKGIRDFQKKESKTISTNTTATCATSLTNLMTMLSERQVTGHEAFKVCLQFLSGFDTERQETIFKALDKDLKIRCGVKIVNKAFPNLVPEFQVALSDPVTKHEQHFRRTIRHWYSSRKLDGNRCLWICENGQARAFSRTGLEYPLHIQGLSYFADQFAHMTGVLDGEMVVMDNDNNEYFSLVNSLMNPKATKTRSKKNLQLRDDQYLCYCAFDFIPLSTFWQGKGGPNLSSRQNELKVLLPKNDKRIRLVKQYTHDKIDSLWSEAVEKNWEGIMHRLDTVYEGKRTKNLLKRKRHQDAEYVIEEAESSMQMDPQSTQPVLALQRVGIRYKGCPVWVGSGFTWAQKLLYGQDPSVLIGHHITVCHFGESRDRKGNYSLRHPTVKALYDQEGRLY